MLKVNVSKLKALVAGPMLSGIVLRVNFRVIP